MLSTEEARARLATLADSGWRAKADKRAAKLPRGLRGTAKALVAPPPDPSTAGVHDFQDAFRAYQDRQAAAARELDAMSEPDRALVMDALHPGLGPALTRWWSDAQDQPYQAGWERKAFRVKGHPALTRGQRAGSLRAIIEVAGPYDADPVWLAIWAGYLGAAVHWSVAPPELGGLLASAVSLGGRTGEETLAALTEIACGEHPAGRMGNHVISALLRSSRPEGWAVAERMLLAAQRQEGLRQSILEAADEAHPEAFDRMLALVLDRKLLRFAASVRAAGVWLGFGASVAEIPMVEDRVRKLAAYRGDAAQRAAALAGQDPWDAWIALNAGGMLDVLATIPQARALAQSPSPDLRAVAVTYAAAVDLDVAQPLIIAAIDDEDIRVAAMAACRLSAGLARPESFDALARLVDRLPVKPREVPGLGVQQVPVTLGKAMIAGRLVAALGGRPASDLLPWLQVMDASGRAQVASLLSGEPRWHGNRQGPPPKLAPELRPVVISLLSDRSSSVRDIALRALARAKLAPAEAPAIEALLTRAGSDIRRGAITLLKSQPLDAARQSAARLAASKDKRQREAAAELLREIGGAGKPSLISKLGAAGAPASAGTTDGSGTPAGDGQSAGPRPQPVEDLHVTLATPQAPAARPRRPDSVYQPDDCAREVLRALDELAGQYRDTEVRVFSWQGSQEMLLADVRYLPSPFARYQLATPEDGPAMILGEVFRDWWYARPGHLRSGDDALDALRAHVLAQFSEHVRGRGAPERGDWWQESLRRLGGNPVRDLKFPSIVEHVTHWLLADSAAPAVIDECLDALQASLAAVPNVAISAAALTQGDTLNLLNLPTAIWARLPVGQVSWRHQALRHPWQQVLRDLLTARPELFTPRQLCRWYELMRWVGKPHPDAAVLPVEDTLLIAAHGAGAAGDSAVALAFLQPRNSVFTECTRRSPGPLAARHPAIAAIAGQVRDRVVAVELTRGDLPTPTSDVAASIASIEGAGIAVRLLAKLGATPLVRGWARSDNREAVLSHLIRVSYPAAGETGLDLRAAAQAAGVKDTRLVDLAIYAPQWARLVQDALEWDGLADGVLWLHAHTKDQHWSVDHELRESWAAMTAERTALSAADLVEGAVDVQWFHRAYGALGEKRWAVLHKAARHASGGTGHRRAQLFAEAMLGQADEAAVTGRIRDKRNADAVRALGLLPLAGDAAARDAAIAGRYAVLREFERGSRQFGSQRQASEKTAVRIGVENLARTAGYPDPLRFTWAVEAAEAGDLADGPVTVTAGEVALTLSVNAEGTPGLVVSRAGRTLKSVPAAVRKDPDITGLQARKTALAKQGARVRASLEAAMVAQDAFTAADFADLRRHPVVAPMLAQLVWVAEDGSTRMLDAGDAGEAGLAGDAGSPAPGAGGPLRIAHPVDLVADSSWVSWQERLFNAGRRQPFKQVFRELYALTAQELAESPVSRRYEGHQLQPRQAQALLGARGWLASHEDGDAARAFHRHDLIARVSFSDMLFTAAEADLPSVEGVHFTRRGEWLAQPLASIPPVVFSEAMRDLDLVVSVAHAGGVDPEATASTTQMRAALIRETARLMKLANIEFATGSHIIITGRLGEYSLHLGSGTVHRRPGGAVCIIPVGSQHRGRLFLPFADDDPKTAEVVSKALMLARDHEIKDPTILEQLRS